MKSARDIATELVWVSYNGYNDVVTILGHEFEFESETEAQQFAKPMQDAITSTLEGYGRNVVQTALSVGLRSSPVDDSIIEAIQRRVRDNGSLFAVEVLSKFTQLNEAGNGNYSIDVPLLVHAINHLRAEVAALANDRLNEGGLKARVLRLRGALQNIHKTRFDDRTNSEGLDYLRNLARDAIADDDKEPQC